MANCDSPFSFWSPTISPRKPVPSQCNNTSSARIVDRTQSNSRTPFPLDRPRPYTCNVAKSSHDAATATPADDSNSNRKEPCCHHAPPAQTPALRVPAGGGFKGVAYKHKVIQPSREKPGQATGEACHDCEQYKADKAKPIEKLIADTRESAKLCAECECHANRKEANYMKSKGHLKAEKEKKEKVISTPPADVCCMEDCVGKRVYHKKASAASGRKKAQQVPPAVRLMDWPWYWSRYFPTAASRVAKRIIQAKVDAANAKLHPQPVAEFQVCFIPSPPKSAADKTTEQATTERCALRRPKPGR